MTRSTGIRVAAAAVLSAAAFGAFADFEISLDVKAEPMKDIARAGCNSGIGFNAAFEAINDEFWFVTNRVETARVFKEAGANLVRLQVMNPWFALRNSKSEHPHNRSNPKAAFDFFKQNGIKTFVCLECYNDALVTQCVEIVKWLVDNDYRQVVAGIEMGNETYGNPKYPTFAPYWIRFIEQAEKIWPNLPLGMNIGELFELNPDIVHMRNRLMSNEELKREGVNGNWYFTAADFNRHSMQFMFAMSNHLDKISHIVYHAYGAETPYSCSYHGFKRFRNFTEMFPILKGKKYWLTEIRPRSDEDNHCQRQFREALIMGHYTLMALCQPETDCFCHHQLTALSGAVYYSDGGHWGIQWYDGSFNELPDFRAPYGLPHAEVGAMGVVYRILGEGIRECPLFLAHGLDAMTGTEEDWCASARLTDDVYARRRAIKEGGDPEKAPKVRGNVEWVAATDAKREKLCLLMVNSKSTPEKVRIKVDGKMFAAPTYRTVTCPEEYLDCCEVPGDGRPWRQVSWEDTTFGWWAANMAMYNGIKPKADVMTVTIKPHTVQSVTVMLRDLPKPAAK